MKRLHPISLFALYVSVLASTMLVKNPVYSAVSLAGSVLIFMCTEIHSKFKELSFYALLFLILSVVNPIFNHRGNTPMFFLNDKPVTFEALFYGINSSAVLLSVLLWCRTLSVYLTNDKLLYIIGRRFPKIAVLLSMVLRFIPDMMNQGKKYLEYKNINEKNADELGVKKYASVFSALVTWSLENGIETADSMKARGFELGAGKSADFFRFRTEDAVTVLLSTVSFVMTCTVLYFSNVNVDFYPNIIIPKIGYGIISISLILIAVYLFPVFFNFFIDKKRNRIITERKKI